MDLIRRFFGNKRNKLITGGICVFLTCVGILAFAQSHSTEDLSASIVFGVIAVLCFVPVEILIKAKESMRNFKRELAARVSDISSETEVEDEIELENNDIDVTIFEVDEMDGHDFEFFCASLLRKNGFSEVSVTKGSGDQGVDILAVKYGIKYAIQCKNYASPLSNSPVQEVNAGKTFYNCHVGVVLTNSSFTPGAKALAQATGVILWDRSVLQELIENME